MTNNEIPEYQGLPADDEVSGHAAIQARLRCYDCDRTFDILGHPRDDVFYCCPFCSSLNRPSLQNEIQREHKVSLPPTSRPPGSYSPPKNLDTVFLRDTSDQIFEIPRTLAESYLITSDRLDDLGHPPFVINLDHDLAEVVGHHKSASGTASDPGSWEYHRDWHHGCYLDSDTGQFFIGIHRHPFGDERAVGALKSDFS